MKISETRMVYFNKTSAMSQPLLTFPVLGFISGYQAAIIFGIGMPALFITMNVTGELGYGILPLLAALAFSMIRPPVSSYESRMASLLRYYVRGSGVKKKKKKTKTAAGPSRPKREKFADIALESDEDFDGLETSTWSDDSTGTYGGQKGDAATDARTGPQGRPGLPMEPLPVVEPMVVHATGGLVELGITLKNRDHEILPNHRVRILLDGNPIRNAVSSASGEIHMILEPDMCTGTRSLSVTDSASRTIVAKEITFVQ